MAIALGKYTLTYSTDERVQGWPSFYSFHPDYMIGMNNYFYTFYQGNLYRHNSNPTRNSWYGQVDGSTLTTVFNTAPLENKLFKTISLQGAEAWSALMETDIQISDTIDSTWFQKKEQVWFAFVRNQSATTNFLLRSVNGIANSISTDTTTASAVVINFDLSVNLSQVSGNPVGSIGDNLFFGTTTPTFCGQVTAVNINIQAGINQLIVDTTVTGGAVPPTATQFFLYAKNSTAESHGVLGHYAKTTLSHPGTTQAELYAIQSDLMKSYP